MRRALGIRRSWRQKVAPFVLLGVVTIPADIAPKIPEAVATVEADERQIIGVCQSKDFTADKLKALYQKIRPGTY